MKKLLFESIQKFDFIIWWITLLFFISSSIFFWWNINETFSWASWIIVLMFLVWFSIELILSALKNVKWIWKITWFITNWPEALVLIVWLISWDILFAASTPLWSNVMNPILLLIAFISTGTFLIWKKDTNIKFFLFSFFITAFLALLFFVIPQNYYLYWILISFVISILIYNKKYDHNDIIDNVDSVSKLYLPLWIIILLIAWYFLDPVVNFTAEASKAPKWIIWFLILSTLTSWPEFKSVIALLNRKKIHDSFINILVSNLTNLWLAIIWVIVWLFIK